MLAWLTRPDSMPGAAGNLGYKVSARKLRLWVEACRELADPKIIPTWVLSDPQGLRGALEDWSEPGHYADGLPVAARADLLRDICGNPRRPVKVWDEPVWNKPRTSLIPTPTDEWWDILEWNGGTVVHLAREIFGEEACGYCTVRGRRVDPGFWLGHKGPCPDCHGTGKITGPFNPSLMPMLGDALEDAGCTDLQILEHLRGPGLHVRGCWVIDSLLGLD